MTAARAFTAAALFAAIDRIKALGPTPPRDLCPLRLNGLPVFEEPSMVQPRVVGHWVYWAHPFVMWLARIFRRPQWCVIRGGEITEFVPKTTSFYINGMLIMHPDTARSLRGIINLDVT